MTGLALTGGVASPKPRQEPCLKVGWNNPCPCGNGKNLKNRCLLRPKPEVAPQSSGVAFALSCLEKYNSLAFR